MSMRILVTGGAGFAGANLALKLKAAYPAYTVVALDNLKRRGSELNLPRLKDAGVDFVHGDIRNPTDFDALPAVDLVIEASAEPSVLAGLDTPPDYVVQTNLTGTVHCLNYALRHRAAVVFLSTSRVYPIEPLQQLAYTEASTRFELADAQPWAGASAHGIAEDFPLAGARSFYGTTKLASELLIEEYRTFYGLQTVINRCGVLTGPWQMGKVDQGVVVLWAAKHTWPGQLKYIGYGGTGKQVRDLLHIDDLYTLVDYQLHHLAQVDGRTYNVGGGRAVSASLRELTELCQGITGNTIPIDPVPEARTADVPIYLTDHRNVTEHLGWKPERTPEHILADIHTWLKAYEPQLKPLLA